MSGCKAGTGISTIGLGDLIEDIAEEIGALARIAEDLDDALGGCLESGSGKPHPGAGLLQDVDLLRQSTQCFERLLKNLAKEDLNSGRVVSARITEGVFIERVRKICDAPPACSQ